MFQRLEHLHRDIFLVATVFLPRGIPIRDDRVQGCNPEAFSCFSLPTAKAAVDKTTKSSRVGVYQAQASGSGWG